MKGALGLQPILFGLLRMTFSDSTTTRTKFLFIQASNMDDEISQEDGGGFTTIQRGKALAKESAMTIIMKQFANYVAKIDIKSAEKCNLAYVLEGLKNVAIGQEAGLLNIENYQRAIREHQLEHPDKTEEKERMGMRLSHAVAVAEQEAPELSEVCEPEAEEEESAEAEPVIFKQRKVQKTFKVGDLVEVYSVKNNKWMTDAEVVEFASEACNKDGLKLRAGSLKIIYAHGSQFKWIPPQHIEELLRMSPRPRPPPPKVGQMLKETHNWFTEWHQRHFEVKRGFLQWWLSEQEAQEKKKPSRSVYLLGLRIQEEHGKIIKLRTDSTNGIVFQFNAETSSARAEWVEALWAHAEYCEEMREFEEAKWVGIEVRKELLDVMAGGVHKPLRKH